MIALQKMRPKPPPCLAAAGSPAAPCPPAMPRPACHITLPQKAGARPGPNGFGLYLVEDLLAAIAENRMQSFCDGEYLGGHPSRRFPRARQLQLLAYVGDLTDVDALHQKIIDFADEANVGLLSTYGRPGWLREGS